MERLSWIHVIIFVIGVCFLAWLCANTNGKQKNTIAWVLCFGMILVSGLRHGYIDTRGYRQGFENLNIDKVFTFEFLFLDDATNKGFTLFSAIIRLFTDNGQVFLLICAAITVGFLFWGIYRNTEDKFLGIFLFVGSSLYLNTMNSVRQCLAGAILFFFLPKLIREKKFWKYTIVVLLVSTIHASALVFIPLYFLATKKAWSWYTVALIVILGLLFVFFNTGIGATVAKLLEGTEYEGYGTMLIEGNTSVNIIRVTVAAVPLLLSFYNLLSERKELRKEKSPMENLVFNMSIINFFCWLFASKVLYFSRLALYFQPFMILLVCQEIGAIKNKEEHIWIRYIAIACFMFFHFYTLYSQGDAFFVGYLKY